MRLLAVLELYKQGAVELDQLDSFGDIQITWCSHVDLTDADFVDAYEG